MNTQKNSCGRPDFVEFVSALRDEASWVTELKSGRPGDFGQSETDAEELVRLADKIEKIGRKQGYL